MSYFCNFTLISIACKGSDPGRDYASHVSSLYFMFCWCKRFYKLRYICFFTIKTLLTWVVFFNLIVTVRGVYIAATEQYELFAKLVATYVQTQLFIVLWKCTLWSLSFSFLSFVCWNRIMSFARIAQKFACDAIFLFGNRLVLCLQLCWQ